MPTVALRIHKAPHPQAVALGYPLVAVRLFADVAFKQGEVWSRYHPAIVDTGAPVSLIPRQIWRSVNHQVIGPVQIGGLIRRDACRIQAQLATIELALSDAHNQIGPLQIHAYLASSDEVPLLIGMCDLIESGELHVAVHRGMAVFEQ